MWGGGVGSSPFFLGGSLGDVTGSVGSPTSALMSLYQNNQIVSKIKNRKRRTNRAKKERKKTTYRCVSIIELGDERYILIPTGVHGGTHCPKKVLKNNKNES